MLRIRTNSLNKSGLIRPHSLSRIFGFFFWWNISDISNIGGVRHDIGHQLSINGNFDKILVISPKYWQYICLKVKKLSVERRGAMEEDYKRIANFFKISTINWRFFGPFFLNFLLLYSMVIFEFLMIRWPRFYPCFY